MITVEVNERAVGFDPGRGNREALAKQALWLLRVGVPSRVLHKSLFDLGATTVESGPASMVRAEDRGANLAMRRMTEAETAEALARVPEVACRLAELARLPKAEALHNAAAEVLREAEVPAMLETSHAVERAVMVVAKATMWAEARRLRQQTSRQAFTAARVALGLA